MISILIIIPAYDGKVSDLTASALYKSAKYFDRIGLRNELLMVANESLISTGRSNLSNFFINNTQHSHAMWIDADIGFQPEDITRLLELNVDLSVGAYVMKTLPPRYCFILDKDQGEKSEKKAVKINSSGFGFNLVSRKVYETMAKKFPELKCIPQSNSRVISKAEEENSFHYFQTMIDPLTQKIISEDKSFFARWKKCGGQSWLRTDIQLQHVGSHVFEGVNLDELL